MSYEAERASIEGRFNTQWNGATPIEWENVDFEPTPGQAYASLVIIGGGISRSIGATAPLFRNYGSIIINIYVPEGRGSNEARSLADTAMAIFRDAQFDGITCYPPDPPIPVGPVKEWYCMSVTIPFYREEVINV